MKSFVARNGIESYTVEINDQIEEVDIKLDSEVRELLNYVKDLRNSSGMHSGWALGTELNSIVTILAMIYNERLEEQEIRDRVPAVQNAWENYRLLLDMVKKDNKQ
jgi:hypothetical protein